MHESQDIKDLMISLQNLLPPLSSDLYRNNSDLKQIRGAVIGLGYTEW